MSPEFTYVESDSNNVWFEFSEPQNCTYFDIYCMNENNSFTSTLDEQFKNGSCTNLDPNRFYQIVMETKNHSSTIVKDRSIFTSNIFKKFFFNQQII